MGGFDLGLQLANLPTRTIAYVEKDKYCQEIIQARIRDGRLDNVVWQ
jgi:site-specific DNA-cytosine methylase